MALDYHLGRTLKLSEDSKFKSLYPWSIQEFEGDDQKGPDYSPWVWGLNFTATKVAYRQHYELGERYRFARPDQDVEPEKPSSFAETENIRLDLRPGYAEEDSRWATTYSMFGTNRNIEDIALWIQPTDSEEGKEGTVIHGGLSYTTEVDFRDETPSDYLHIYAGVSRERFDAIKERVKRGDFDVAAVSISAVAGIYAPWSPGISTDRVKVLSRPEDHKLELPEGGTIKPPVLGDVGKFNLHLIRDRKMELPIFATDDDDGADYGEVIDPAALERARADQLLRLVSKLEEKSKAAQIALWVIAGLLVLALLK